MKKILSVFLKPRESMKNQLKELGLETFLTSTKELVDQHLTHYLNLPYADARSAAVSCMQHSVFGSAKRIRPILSLLIHALYSDDRSKILPFTCSLELFHTFSLIHDDLPALDDDDLRRGRPTAHVKFGEDLAILSADILHTQAFSIVTHQLPKHYPAERVIGVLKLMTEAFGLEGVIGGEIIDVKNGATNLAELREMHRLKTGELIRCACLVPAYLENCSESDRHHIDQFASHLGVLFQIVDDLLDHTGSAEELGKTPGKDQIQNKLTYVSLLGLEGAKSEARAERGLALEYLKALKKDTGILEEFVDYIFSRTN